MNIKVARSWHELNEWQLQEIVDLYLNDFDKNPEKAYQKMIFILFQEKPGFWHRMKLWKLIRLVSLSELTEFGEFLMQPPKIHRFPEIKGLIKPADRLGDLSIKQFSFMDHFFYNWMETKSEKMLRALCASIYRINDFDEQKLPEIAKITDRLSQKQRQVIGFTYMSCYHHLAEHFPVVYPKPKKKDGKEKKPRKNKHLPFSEIIINMVMNEETQPLGNFHESNSTRIYEFMNVLTKIIIKNKKIEQEYAKRK